MDCCGVIAPSGRTEGIGRSSGRAIDRLGGVVDDLSFEGDVFDLMRDNFLVNIIGVCVGLVIDRVVDDLFNGIVGDDLLLDRHLLVDFHLFVLSNHFLHRDSLHFLLLDMLDHLPAVGDVDKLALGGDLLDFRRRQLDSAGLAGRTVGDLVAGRAVGLREISSS